MGALTKAVAPALGGGTDSGPGDLLHMIMGAHSAGQAGYHPLAGLFGGMQSLATGGQPHTPDSLHGMFQGMGLQPSNPNPIPGVAAAGIGQMTAPQPKAPDGYPQPMGQPPTGTTMPGLSKPFDGSVF